MIPFRQPSRHTMITLRNRSAIPSIAVLLARQAFSKSVCSRSIPYSPWMKKCLIGRPGFQLRQSTSRRAFGKSLDHASFPQPREPWSWDFSGAVPSIAFEPRDIRRTIVRELAKDTAYSNENPRIANCENRSSTECYKSEADSHRDRYDLSADPHSGSIMVARLYVQPVTRVSHFHSKADATIDSKCS